MNANQLEHYDQNGFLVIENFIDLVDCDQLRQRANQIVSDFDPKDIYSIFSARTQNRFTNDYFLESAGSIRCFFEEDAFAPDGSLKQAKEQSINKIGHALHDLDQVFDRFSRSSKIKQLIASMGVEAPLLLQSMYIFKQPNIGGEVACHQDTTFLYTEPFSVMGLWFALEDATVNNGCMWVIPGGHQMGLKSRWLRTTTGMEFQTLDSTPWPEDQLIPVEVKKGSLVVLHGLLPHLSLANTSPHSRHAYTLHIISGKAEYSALNWLQRTSELPLKGF